MQWGGGGNTMKLPFGHTHLSPCFPKVALFSLNLLGCGQKVEQIVPRYYPQVERLSRSMSTWDYNVFYRIGSW